MAIQKITADVISSDAITTASISDSAITAAKLAGTLDLTGKTITVATASSGDNDTSIASTAFVQQEIAALVDSAPGTLNTLNELAAALGDDANFSTTVTNSIATKLPLAGGSLTGGLTITAGGDNLKLKRSSFDDILLGIGTGNNQSGLHITNTTDTVTIASIHENAPAGSLVMDSSGNIGIGTSSPGVALDLETAGNTADGTYYSTFTINNTGSSTWSRIRFDRSGVAKWGLSLGTDDKFKISNLYTGGTTANPDDNALVIDNNSNVGIGTDSPDGLLHISSGTAGDAILILESDTDNNDEADNPQIWLKGDGDITKGAVRVSDNELEIISNVSAASGIKFYTGSTDNTGTTDPGTSATQRMHIESNGKIDISGYGTEGAYLSSKGSFRIDIDNDNDHTDRAFIISSNNAVSDLVTVLEGGNVGIGTSSPQSGLHIAEGGSGSDGGSVLTLSQTGFGSIVNNDDLGSVHFGGVTGGGVGIHNAAKIMVEGDATWASNDYPTRMSFFTTADGASSATERMRIDSSGNVGIGRTSPSAKLHVEVADNTEFLKATITGNEEWAFKGASGSGATDYVSFGISGSTQCMTWQEQGYVTTPNQPAFHAYGPSAAVSTGNYVVYANTYVNTGSHYSTSNGRFTAPVAGVYLFFWSAIGNNTNDVYRWFLYKNGSVNAGGGNDIHLRQDTGATGSEYATNGSRVQMLSLSANDYVQIYFSADSNTSGYYQSDYVNFGGYLIG